MQRMRLLILVGLACVLAMAPAIVCAQGAKRISFGVMAGLSLPVNYPGDGVDSGYNLTCSVHVPLGRELWFRGDTRYESFGAKGVDQFDPAPAVGDEQVQVRMPVGARPLRLQASDNAADQIAPAGPGTCRASCSAESPAKRRETRQGRWTVSTKRACADGRHARRCRSWRESASSFVLDPIHFHRP